MNDVRPATTVKCRHCGKYVSLDKASNHMRNFHQGIAAKIYHSMRNKIKEAQLLAQESGGL